MSGVPAPSVLIMSVASGDREREKATEKKRSMSKNNKEKWLIEVRETKRVRRLIGLICKYGIKAEFKNLFLFFLSTGGELDQFFKSCMIITAFGCFRPLSK